MKNILFIGLSVILALVVVVGFFLVGNSSIRLGSLNVGGYSSGVTNTSSTLNYNVATSLLSTSAQRQFVEICNKGVGTVWLYKIATSTGVAIEMGQPVFASSTNQRACIQYNTSDPYTGPVWGIADATTTVSIQYK